MRSSGKLKITQYDCLVQLKQLLHLLPLAGIVHAKRDEIFHLGDHSFDSKVCTFCLDHVIYLSTILSMFILLILCNLQLPRRPHRLFVFHLVLIFHLPGKQHGFKQNNTVFGLLLNNSTALRLNVPHKCTANNIIE